MHIHSQPVFVLLSLLAFGAATVTPTLSSAQAANAKAPVVVQGTLTAVGNAAGASTAAPSMGGVRVALYAMPTQPFMNKIRPGTKVQGKLVGVTTSSAAGTYAIRVAHPATITSSAYKGLVNVEVWADGHGYWSVYGLSLKLGAKGALEPLFGPATTAPARAPLTMYKLNKHDAAIPAATASSGCWVLAKGGDLGPTAHGQDAVLHL